MTPGARIAATPDLPVLMVVGNISDWERTGKSLPHGPGLQFLDFQELDASALQRIGPEVIISGLINPGFDAMDLAVVLYQCGYLGRYRVIADRVPKPGLIRSDVRHVAPGLDFDVINLRGEIEAYL